ncbi:potassium transporter Kup [Chelatococcus reniformis]|uniref:Probable potassium transport system protein Kup n=1 Tax=Chelatococcus reniformis TaxID=1494448 RepID=A0A916U712_9HYPH|nr:potassium transporter Kup [Chelatococcus reniformis]GGC61755.1 putative potassium transport system protein kup 2 [Chelatococcus reniformis]
MPADTALAADPQPAGDGDPSTHVARPGFWTLVVGSAGVVYGDIGTSPLYAFREAVTAARSGGAPTAEAVLGVLSLILWALILVVTVKYVILLLRADNNGEGGTLSLMALAQRALRGRRGQVVATLGMLGAALFYGDAIITPAISVLSAVEGLKLVTPVLDPYVLQITIVILVGLFLVQSRGTARVAAFFGPVMLLWFAVLALGGLIHIADEPGVFAAFDPRHAVSFLLGNGYIGLLTLGAVFLAVTGAEALYADLGHFGRRPIQLTWLVMALPALVLNYLGQGALVLAQPDRLENPFFLLYPAWALAPVVALATAATVIASQAVITGAFSLSRQAIQLGLLPRLEIRYTSEAHAGQIYVPRINVLLLIGVIVAVVMYRSSSALASAYGIAVSGTMVVTALMAFVVIWKIWRWPVWAAALVMAPFLAIETIFLLANLLKVLDGGLFPIMLGGAIMLLMISWRRGTRMVLQKTRRTEMPIAELLDVLAKSSPHRVRGTAVFLTSDPAFAPTALLHNLKHNKVMHEKNVILTVTTDDRPWVPDAERVLIEPIRDGFSRVSMAFGYAETPNVPRGLAIARSIGWRYDIMATSFFVSRRSLKAGATTKMPRWQTQIFLLLARNASDATDFFQIPTGRVVEVGTQVTI